MPSITNYFKPVNSGAVPAAAAAASTAAVRKRTTLSAAARAAILDAKDEPPSKRAKGATAATSAATTVSTVPIPRASTREELQKSLASNESVYPLLQLELDTLGEDWLVALQEELTKPYFVKLKKFVTDEQKAHTVFPPAEDIYSWSRLCALKNVRVIIVGQDPYHDVGQAHGLAFSVRPGVRVPPSLRNMYKELSSAVPGFVAPKDGDLRKWAEQGVLLLNTALTVRAHQANSHAGQGWEVFTAAVLSAVTEMAGSKGVVIMAWGAHAGRMIGGLNTKRHLVLKSAHPSPLSASRGFFGNGHFVKSDVWLKERYGRGVDWVLGGK